VLPLKLFKLDDRNKIPAWELFETMLPVNVFELALIS
jgi:hypothetical protein